MSKFDKDREVLQKHSDLHEELEGLYDQHDSQLEKLFELEQLIEEKEDELLEFHKKHYGEDFEESEETVFVFTGNVVEEQDDEKSEVAEKAEEIKEKLKLEVTEKAQLAKEVYKHKVSPSIKVLLSSGKDALKNVYNDVKEEWDKNK